MLQCLQQEKSQTVWITVFVHGAIGSMIERPSITRYRNLLRDRIDGTLYEKATRYIRNSNWYEENQPAQSLGLQKINKLDKHPAVATAKTFDYFDLLINNRHPDKNYYYTYGWHGLASPSKQLEVSEQLYESLTKEIQKFKAQNIQPKLRIIGFSNGGRVILQLGLINEKMNGTLTVDEVMLFGTPIHQGMDYLTKYQCFKSIYNFYSNKDFVQKLDLLSEGSFFSKRTFENRKNFKVPDKIKQIRITIRRNKTTKKQWGPDEDPRNDFKNPLIVSGKSNLLRTMSPSHGEMWYFGWSYCGYRDNFPLMPLPILSLTPIIINAIEKQDKSSNNKFLIDLRPQQNTMLVKYEKSCVTVPFLQENVFDNVKTLTYKHMRRKISPKQYHTHIDKLVQKANLSLKRKKSSSIISQ